MATLRASRLFQGLNRVAARPVPATRLHPKVYASWQIHAQDVPLRRFTTTRPSNLADENNNNNNNDEDGPPTPNITNYYTLFSQTLPKGPPPATPFDLPLRPLRAEFLTLQNQLHPDKYPPGAPKQRAEALSALLNEAHRTLADPLSRAQYLLRIQYGIDVTAEDSAEKDKQALDPETLMAVMEVQERIEEVAAEPPAEAEGVIAEMRRENDERVRGSIGILGEMVDRGDVERMRRECVRLRFWYSVGEGLKEWEPGVREIRLVH